MSVESLLVWLGVGATFGFLYGALFRGAFGLVGNMVAGVVGAFIGGWGFGVFGIAISTGLANTIVTATLGAAVSLILCHLLLKRATSLVTAARSEQPRTPVANVAPHPAMRSVAAREPADVFISYKREERGRVEAIATALRALKLTIWFDARLTTGRHFDEEINREVRSARTVLVCWSKAAVASEWVRAEATIGRERGVLTACFLEDCEPYTPFNLVHTEDLRNGTLDAANPAWLKIVEQVGHLVGRNGLRAYLELPASHSSASAEWLEKNSTDPLAEALRARMSRS